MEKESFKFLCKLTFILVIVAFLSFSANAQKFNLQSNVDQKIYAKWPILNYFANRYELTISFFPSTGHLQLLYPHRIFAIKDNKYYKIDCLINFSVDADFPENIVIKKIRRFSEKEGRAFVDSLMSHHILTLESQDSWRKCVAYDSSHKREVEYSISDGGTVRFEIFNKESYRSNTYDAVDFYMENCPSEPAKNIQALIDLFEKHW